MNILDMIDKPQDLRNIRKDLLPILAKDIRQKILDVTSQVGGHLGAGLGTVELAIALHYVFESPKDKIIWDTGHQAYPHKLLTGRRDRFHTLRQFGGISGFLSRNESEHDVFGAGHASTSISAALGFAAARDVLKQDHHVIAVANDGSLTGGMAFEALQNAGHLGTDLLVVLNDNQMFISHRVGALGAFLAKLATLGMVRRAEKQIEKLLTRMSFYGAYLLRLARRAKVMLFPGVLFEEMGFGYLGPIDGHDLPQLIDVLQAIKQLKGPHVLHVVTKKGRGYEPAESDPIKYHGVTRFNPETGEMVKAPAGPPSYTTVFGQALVKLAKEDPKIVAITAAMPEGTGLDLFRKEIPARFYDVGLGEQHAVTFATGMACGGLKPVVAIYSTFLQRGFDQMFHDVALQKLPVVFCLDRAGLVGEDGPTHHGAYDLSYSRMFPNMTVMAPKDENELQHMLKTALNLPGPSVIRYPRGAGQGVALDTAYHLIPLGKGEILREGEDVTLLAIGHPVVAAMEAAEKLAAEGVSVRVVNARFAKPLDREFLLGVARRTPLLVTLEENTFVGGFGDAVREALEGENIAVRTIALPDAFVEHGAQPKIREKAGLSAEKIAARVMEFRRQRQAVS
ncbi:MAG TPA: 1-deoxy-D-xylulose-5-phosphate synthase [Elusimicrobiota bacterium]|nr:1-deoxy-D-xylulose-5-phosphate synthase [Elusimicrobiota bacterium]